MKAHRRQKLILILAGILGLGATVALVLIGLGSNINAFYSPTDVAEGKAPLNTTIRIGGLVKEGTVSRDPQSLKVSFTLQTQGDEVDVKFEGILPDLFREGQGIVTQGKLVAPRSFEAIEVLAKHDENYMPPEIAKSLEKVKHQKTNTESE